MSIAESPWREVTPPVGSGGDKSPQWEWSWSLLRWRILQELVLLWKVWWWQLLMCMFLVLYVASIVGRNIAFSRHWRLEDYLDEPTSVKQTLHWKQHVLRDLGFDYLPDYTGNWYATQGTNWVQYANNALLAGIAFSSWFYTCNGTRPYVMNIGMRYYVMLAWLHMLRIPIYLSTSQPGPAAHCQGETEVTNKPSADQIFTHVLKPDTGCGDLIYSGHQVMACTCALLSIKYAGMMFQKRTSYILSAAAITLMLGQTFMVIVSHNHYTVDPLVGYMASGFVFMLDEKFFHKEDPDPCEKYPDIVSLKWNPDHVKKAISPRGLEMALVSGKA